MNRQRLYGRVDYRKKESNPPGTLMQALHGAVFVDGVRIYQVWYADTEAGIVKTYDVFRDNEAHVNSRTVGGVSAGHVFTAADFPGREVDCPIDGVLSETLRGTVELYGPESPTVSVGHGTTLWQGNDDKPERFFPIDKLEDIHD